MYRIMSPERRAAIFGAYLANQVSEYIRVKGTAPDLDMYYSFLEEAEAVEDSAVEAYSAKPVDI